MTQVFVWTLGDVLAIAAVVIFALLALAAWVPQWIKMAKCKHDGGVRETRSCDAICDKCGKNLGFIGALRK